MRVDLGKITIPELDLKVSKSGDTMTGELNLEVPLAIESGGTGGSTETEAREALGVPSYVMKNSYWGIAAPSGDDATYMRTPVNGILPYKSGGSGYLGTSGWPFSYVYTNGLYVGTRGYNGGSVVATNHIWVSSGTVSSVGAFASTTKTVTATLPNGTVDYAVVAGSMDYCTGYASHTRSGNTVTVTFYMRRAANTTGNVAMSVVIFPMFYGLTNR